MPDERVRTPIARVGFIGTGLLGTPMVQRLLECRIKVTVWNRTTSRLAPLVASGALAASSAHDLARNVDVVCLCLSDTNAVDDVMFGPGGIADVMREGQLVVDFSSVGSDATVQMATRLATVSGAGWIDAPVSGGLSAARAGRLIVFAGGDAADIARVQPVFAALSMRVSHMGGHGTGQLTKSCNQMIVACNLLVIAEMLAFARAVGIDAARLPAALAGGFADSLPMQIFGARMAAHIDNPRIGALSTVRKDIEQVAALAAAAGAFVPMTERAVTLYREASELPIVGADADASRVIRMFEALAHDGAATSETQQVDA